MIQPCDDLPKEVDAAQELERFFVELTDNASTVVDDARKMAAIEGARVRVSVERSIMGIVAGVFGLIVLGVVGALAAARLVSGLAAGLARATGSAWAGDLGAGLFFLLLFGVGGARFWRWRDGRRLAELMREIPEPKP